MERVREIVTFSVPSTYLGKERTRSFQTGRADPILFHEDL